MSADYYGAFVASQNDLAQTRFELNGRIAQLEDELTISRDQISKAYESVKPPVNIDTSTSTVVDSAGGSVSLPDNGASASKSSALAVWGVVFGVVSILLTLLLMRKKGR